MVAGGVLPRAGAGSELGRLADGVGAHRPVAGHRRGVHGAGQHGRAHLYGGIAAQPFQEPQVYPALPSPIRVHVFRLVGGHVRGAHPPRPRGGAALVRLRLGRARGARHIRARVLFRLRGGRGEPLYCGHIAKPHGHTDVLGHRDASAHVRHRLSRAHGIHLPLRSQDREKAGALPRLRRGSAQKTGLRFHECGLYL